MISSSTASLWTRLAPLLALLAGCAGASEGGGPIGTGIISSVVGNVVAVVAEADEAASTALDFPTVTVSIDEVPGLDAATDAAGNFALEGDFSGPVTLRFRAAGVEATQALDVPTGALVVLADVVVAPGRIDAEAGRQLDFLARVESADCEAAKLIVTDERRAHSFVVLLVDETGIQRRDGSPASCGDIRAGDRIGIGTVFEPSAGPGTEVTALLITIGAERGERPDVVEDVPFAGFVAGIDCTAGALTVSNRAHRTRLRLTRETILLRAGGSTLGCEDLAIGDRVAGLGRLRLREPGRIEATRVVVATGPGAVDVRLFGVVVATDCTASVLLVDDGDVTIDLRLGPDTMIKPPLSCDEIPIGARVGGFGRPRPGMPGVVDALQLRIRRPAA
ncbi:MAG: hypothetical protein FJ144_05920 [Deltaproteobacteria bacterium]|nr:hypothetical protein [Deltaproteobacteria bacterium]